MKIAVIDAAVPGLDAGTEAVLKIVTDTLSELGEELLKIKISEIGISFPAAATGTLSDASVSNAIFSMISADAAVFAVPARFFGPSVLASAFFEHFSDPQFQRALLDKNCMAIVTSSGDSKGIRETFECLSGAISFLGGFDAVRAFAPARLAENGDADLKHVIEKQTEDFYRILRQNRKFYAYGASRDDAVVPYAVPRQEEAESAESIRELIDSAESIVFTDGQKADINEITRLLSEKFTNPQPGKEEASPARPKTCRQMTASLPHYFNSQLASDIDMSIFLSITGSEEFSGRIEIGGGRCDFLQGDNLDTEQEADIAIFADSAAWSDVLSGKFTAQNAFMTGRIRVRGNFLLLPKFDQLFEKMIK